jgi:hypothetical protein
MPCKPLIAWNPCRPCRFCTCRFCSEEKNTTVQRMVNVTCHVVFDVFFFPTYSSYCIKTTNSSSNSNSNSKNFIIQIKLHF